MNIKTYLDGKYTVSHHMMDKACTDTNIHKPAAYMQTPFNKATACCSPIPTIYYLPRMNTLAVTE